MGEGARTNAPEELSCFQGWGPARHRDGDRTGLAIDAARLFLTHGRCAQERAAQSGHADTAVFDRLLQWHAAPNAAVVMLVNEAADAVLQGVCSEGGADRAVKLGVNYPSGPFEWLQAWGAPGVMAVLDALDAHYRGERYRASPWLRR